MALGFVQGKAANSGSGSTTVATLTFASNVTAGNLLVVVAVAGIASGGSLTITDSLSNSWSTFERTSSTNNNWWRSEAIAGTTGACTITFTFQFSQAFPELYIVELNVGGNAAVRDGTPSAVEQATTTSFASGNITTTQNPDVLLCFYNNNGSTFGVSGENSPWSENVYNGTDQSGFSSAVETTTSTFSLTGTQVSGGNSSIIYAWKATASGVTDINATAALAPDAVLTLGAQLAQKDVVSLLPGTLLTLAAKLTEPDIVGLAPQILLALNADVLEEAVMSTTPATTLAITASIQNIDLNAATSIAPGTTATLIPGAGISATVFI